MTERQLHLGSFDPTIPGRVVLHGAPEGQDARALAALAAKAGPAGVLHVALDDARMARLADAVAFFAPEIEIVTFPAWDCLPYDRVSPNNDIASRRIDALTRLIEPREAGPRIVLTTVNALVQRVPPREIFRDSVFRAKAGDRLDVDRLIAYLGANGYVRAQTVREPGEFAIRGGIVDLFPPGTGEPLRLDLFGDELEAVRAFDPLSQRTLAKRQAFTLKPMSEAAFDDEAIGRFRVKYRELFGAVTDDDPLYEAISEKRRYAGMEHWLPLFHERMETLFDYLPGAAVTLDHQAEEVRDARLAQVADAYEARRTMQAVERRANAPVYKPLPPERLYLSSDELSQRLDGRAVALLSPFAAPEAAVGAIDLGGRRGRDFADARVRQDVSIYDAVREHVVRLQAEGRRVLVAGYSIGARDRLAGLLREHAVAGVTPVDGWEAARKLAPNALGLVVLGLETGFAAPDLAVISEQDILGDRIARPVRRRRKSDKFIQEVTALSAGDIVVHMDHGIGRYDGLETLTVSGAPHDCLRVIYEGGDKLYVPVENIEVLSRYGSEDANVNLDKLGGGAWESRKQRVKKRIKDLTDALMKIAAERELRRTDAVTTPEGLYDEFAARFPYPETEDQLRAIEEVFEDLRSGRPMDRLVCGDVGFGKTEVALRAAFMVALSGQQVAVVVPTTLLARQHFNNFTERFAGFPVRIQQLSRLVTPAEAKKVRRELEEGTVDILIGTHAVLGKDVRFKRLGLVVVDEEQHFGVKQKERLKELRADVHVLTLTATPIPRTLQMALAGVRELSLIATAPVDRLAVRTFVLPYDPVIVREAILREHYRGGQSFFVCPRIEDLPKVEERLRELVPEVKFVTAHGRMAASELEDVMSAFDEGKYDVLLATNIIESGLDIPNANTLIVHRADMFGLSQLYQIRGRVGRSKTRGYAYLTYAPRTALSTTAQQRLHVIETLDSLGAGFSLASHDMDIRGAGNLLGEEQSGHVREVGVELYQRLLEEAVSAAKAGLLGEAEAAESWTPQINLGTAVLIPDTYVADLNVRLELYRRIATLVDAAEIDSFAAELVDRFGPMPPEVENLLEIVAIKRLCRTAGVDRLDAGPKGAMLSFHNNRFEHVDRLMEFVTKNAAAVKLRPDHKLVYARVWDDPAIRIRGVRRLMQDLAKLAA